MLTIADSPAQGATTILDGIPLSTPVRLGSVALSGRVVMGPALHCHAGAGRVPTLAMLEHYAGLAPCAALLLAEPTPVAADGTRHQNAPGLYSPEQAVAWRGITDSVHQAGSRIAARLCHIDAWNINCDGHALADEFGRAAQRARMAGFDMVEIDALGLIARPQALAGRLGLIVDAVMAFMGPGRTGVRLNLGGACARGQSAPAPGRLGDALCLLDRAGVGYLHLQSPLSSEPDTGLVRGFYRGRLILNTGGGVRTGQQLVARGIADAVVLPTRLVTGLTDMVPAAAAE